MFQLLSTLIGFQVVLTYGQVVETAREPALNATQFPYQVLISQLDESPKCGGALVAEGFILTSATCVLKFGGIQMFLEEAVLYGGGTTLLFNIGDVKDAAIHPQYTDDPVKYDMSIIKYVPESKGPRLNATGLSRIWSDHGMCIMTSWWAVGDKWPEHLMWEMVSPIQCSPSETNLFCFSDKATLFHRYDLGSPIVCGGVLSGLVPNGGGNRAINLTSMNDWITKTMKDMTKTKETIKPAKEEDPKLYFMQILQKLDQLTYEKLPDTNDLEDNFNNWNKQVVVPLNYVLYAMVIFFLVLLLFIILFTIVLVYYSRK